ncbi:MAG: Abi family protein [Bacteroidales bacterium]|nr:Abi family protein [Bacteroidales bacterium]
MNYSDFEHFMSQKRLSRYLSACHNDKRKAMTLYRLNMRLAQELLTMVACFEVSLRNAIDNILVPQFGAEWLKDSVSPGGIFTNPKLCKTFKTIDNALRKLSSQGTYSHSKLLAQMDFGMWKYMFSPVQYTLTNQSLLKAFPFKQRSTPQLHINQSYIFNELDKVNTLRNRIAHHEPLCFPVGQAVIDTTYVRVEYNKIKTLYAWMGIDSSSMLYGLDHVLQVCDKIDKLQ